MTVHPVSETASETEATRAVNLALAALKPSVGIQGLIDAMTDGTGFTDDRDFDERLVIRYGFLNETTEFFNHSNANTADDFVVFNAEQIASFNNAIAIWEQFAFVDFVQMENEDSPGYLNGGESGIELFVGGFGSGSAFAFASVGSGSTTFYEGNAWFNLSNPAFSGAGLDYGGRGMRTFLHELGHVLGLQHPGNYDASDDEEPSFWNSADFREDNRSLTIMSYFSETFGGSDFFGVWPSTPMPADILALNQLYLPPIGWTSWAGNTVYGAGGIGGALYISGAADKIVGTIYDYDGDNWLDVRPYVEAATINLNEMFQSVGGLINNLAILGKIKTITTGAGDDTITGSTDANFLDGGAGNDSIKGGVGADTIYGGLGHDRLEGETGADRLSGGDGDDTLLGGADKDELRGDAGRDSLDGGTNADLLLGGSGNDTVVGSGSGDSLFGGTDHDVVVVGFGTQADFLSGGAGWDTLSFAGLAVTPGQSGIGLDLTNLAAVSGLPGPFNPYRRIDEAGQALPTPVLDFERFAGSNGDDTMQGDSGTNDLAGGLGNDLLFGRDGHDYLAGDDGADFLDGGAGDDSLWGGSGNDLLKGGAGADLMRGELGTDTASYAGSAAAVSINLSSGTGAGGDAQGDKLIAVENAIGSSHADTLIGGFGDNRLQGEGGDDLLRGRGGADWLDGGAGFDTADYSELALDVTIDLASGSASGTGAAGDTLTGIEAVLGSQGDDSLTGDEQDNRLVGNQGDDTLEGAGGDDTLEGGTGADVVLGGAGDDLYLVRDAGDVLVELDGEGHDVIRASVSMVLGAHFERLELIGAGELSGTGNEGDNAILGNTGKNLLLGLGGTDSLYGGDGADTLDGGWGADLLVGGTGDDRYVVDTEEDVVVEFAGGGLDTVRALFSYTLGAHLENLVLSAFEPVPMDGTGNALANLIIGTTGNNALSGMMGNDTLIGGAGDDTLTGGEGADSMVGGTGDDLYVVDDLSDAIVEAARSGTDTVWSSLDHTLGANLENLVLTGTQSVTGSGNAVANVLTGNSGDNTLEGMAGNDTLQGGLGDDVLDGGTGYDTMEGGAGDDIYRVDSTADVVIETLADIPGRDASGEPPNPDDGGIDLVLSLITYTLGANLENLKLLGSASIRGTGNALDNVITGNDGANRLTGADGDDVLSGGYGSDVLLGGAGEDTLMGGPGDDADTLVGGADADWFLFGALIYGSNAPDRIKDFLPGTDSIVLDHRVFGFLPGALAGALFEAGTLPSGRGPRILYEAATGILRWDEDGAGTDHDTLAFAQLDTRPALTAGDFLII
ncbi:M10 family metallopeptidase C-terminal domain-containing protein [Roseococcus sp. SDR]|uniref:M10 family metallopeptidase C-terminal domain-containing protein n=1 Tax=Roseococcus sp. SDR TaxID=2835532 RepID=UPI001BCFC24D|nr:M10 family metallopeptidase C-terminal domain-containing protein [Roseococcus sp. SDR]MBS7788758.1 M10 family metallopeptidase C-terminal domain-containing protein [Roseococcus sp. SDR]MBV1844072.1 M10 family metallopeptidase C-terminal domain-containing protein [Roseococcus sp. SDR]